MPAQPGLQDTGQAVIIDNPVAPVFFYHTLRGMRQDLGSTAAIGPDQTAGPELDPAEPAHHTDTDIGEAGLQDALQDRHPGGAGGFLVVGTALDLLMRTDDIGGTDMTAVRKFLPDGINIGPGSRFAVGAADAGQEAGSADHGGFTVFLSDVHEGLFCLYYNG